MLILVMPVLIFSPVVLPETNLPYSANEVYFPTSADVRFSFKLCFFCVLCVLSWPINSFAHPQRGWRGAILEERQITARLRFFQYRAAFGGEAVFLEATVGLFGEGHFDEL